MVPHPVRLSDRPLAAFVSDVHPFMPVGALGPSHFRHLPLFWMFVSSAPRPLRGRFFLIPDVSQQFAPDRIKKIDDLVDRENKRQLSFIVPESAQTPEINAVPQQSPTV